jgi:pimeloyl-ACP methyl ester carboxylesterase
MIDVSPGCGLTVLRLPIVYKIRACKDEHTPKRRDPQMVKKRALRLFALVAPLMNTIYAQDIAGDWQGTLKAGSQELRLVVQIARADNGGWKASLYSIDQTTEAIPVDSVALESSTLKLTVNAVRGNYEGKISADEAVIDGTWTQGGPLPLVLRRATKESAWPLDSTAHSVQFITVDNNVKLEVLDWGGGGRPVVLLTGLGNNAHVYDKLAPKLTASYHVYGITRRGFGASSAPATGYSADRLGDDVLAVLDTLKLNRPVLVGHSIAGEELSSVGSRHPEKVSGLVYLDCYGYAYYDRYHGYIFVDVAELQKKLSLLQSGTGKEDPKQFVQGLLETSLPAVERDLRELQKDFQAMPAAMLAEWSDSETVVNQAIMAGEQKYTNIPVPILAIYAVPHELGPKVGNDPGVRAAVEARDEAWAGAQAKAFETGVPSARVVRLPHANHYVFKSNEADVLREMNAFIGSLQ